jgi:hypothetical protein
MARPRVHASGTAPNLQQAFASGNLPTARLSRSRAVDDADLARPIPPRTTCRSRSFGGTPRTTETLSGGPLPQIRMAEGRGDGRGRRQSESIASGAQSDRVGVSVPTSRQSRLVRAPRGHPAIAKTDADDSSRRRGDDRRGGPCALGRWLLDVLQPDPYRLVENARRGDATRHRRATRRQNSGRVRISRPAHVVATMEHGARHELPNAVGADQARLVVRTGGAAPAERTATDQAIARLATDVAVRLVGNLRKQASGGEGGIRTLDGLFRPILP